MRIVFAKPLKKWCARPAARAIASSWDAAQPTIWNRTPDAFHVFIYAPFEEKIQRLRGMGKSEDEAQTLAETVDRDRAAYIKQYFNIEWPYRELYHLMLNSKLGDDFAVDMILDSVAMLQKAGMHP